MFPRSELSSGLLGEATLADEHGQDGMAEELLQGREVQVRRRAAERALAILDAQRT